MKEKNGKQIMVFGATSAIAQAAIRRWAGERAQFHLVGRQDAKLQAVAKDATARGASAVACSVVNLCDPSAIARFFQEEKIQATAWDLLLIAQGVLPEQGLLNREPERVAEPVSLNLSGPIQICLHALSLLSRQTRGGIMVLSSVSGERARRDSLVYAATKSGLSTFLAGLQLEAAEHGVMVWDIRPGFVATPMTEHMQKNFLFVTPDRIARDLDRAWKRGRGGVVYTPWFWRWVLLLVRNLPTFLFRKIGAK